MVEVTGRTLVQPTTAVQTLIDSRAGAGAAAQQPQLRASSPTLAPGVSSDLADEVGVGLTSTVSLSVNGARRNAVNWLVDGVSNVDVGSNITLLVDADARVDRGVQDHHSSYAAEWPRSGGGIVNVVTKSGTSRFSGSAYEFFRNDALNRNSYFRKQSTDPAIRDNAPDLDYNNFGYTIGGPLLPSKEKAFFFFSRGVAPHQARAGVADGNVPNPDWLTDPTSANYVRAGRARSERGAAAGRGYPGAEPAAADAGRGRPLPGDRRRTSTTRARK